jgi:hypothetical protein
MSLGQGARSEGTSEWLTVLHVLLDKTGLRRPAAVGTSGLPEPGPLAASGVKRPREGGGAGAQGGGEDAMQTDEPAAGEEVKIKQLKVEQVA